ncbi:MAG: hypothetical protein KAS71_15410, partial [Bacteroidales bacterium]|nr:hypothetical protein [Bacteroidales bacterium]
CCQKLCIPDYENLCSVIYRLDSDVLRHFIKGKSIDKLSKILPNQLYLLDIVETEICRSKKIEPIIKGLINDGSLKAMNFPGSKLTEYCVSFDISI